MFEVLTRRSLDSDGVEIVVVAPVGDLDLGSAPQFRSALLAASVAAPEPVRLVVDLAGVDHLDGVGVGVMLEGRRRVRQRRGEFVLVGPEPHVRRDLDLLGVQDVLRSFDSLAEALAMLSKGPAI